MFTQLVLINFMWVDDLMNKVSVTVKRLSKKGGTAPWGAPRLPAAEGTHRGDGWRLLWRTAGGGSRDRALQTQDGKCILLLFNLKWMRTA
jgi:hypothetical protein